MTKVLSQSIDISMANLILIVEDDITLQEMYRDEFLQADFQVDTASDGQEAMVKITTQKPSAILLDLIMPKMSGFDVLEKIKKDPSLNKIPILVLTNVRADVEDLIANWGVAGFILKSDADPGMVIEKVKKLISQASPQSI